MSDRTAHARNLVDRSLSSSGSSTTIPGLFACRHSASTRRSRYPSTNNAGFTFILHQLPHGPVGGFGLKNLQLHVRTGIGHRSQETSAIRYANLPSASQFPSLRRMVIAFPSSPTSSGASVPSPSRRRIGNRLLDAMQPDHVVGPESGNAAADNKRLRRQRDGTDMRIIICPVSIPQDLCLEWSRWPRFPVVTINRRPRTDRTAVAFRQNPEPLVRCPVDGRARAEQCRQEDAAQADFGVGSCISGMGSGLDHQEARWQRQVDSWLRSLSAGASLCPTPFYQFTGSCNPNFDDYRNSAASTTMPGPKPRATQGRGASAAACGRE